MIQNRKKTLLLSINMLQKQFSTKSDGKRFFFEMLKGKTKIHQNQAPAILIVLIISIKTWQSAVSSEP